VQHGTLIRALTLGFEGDRIARAVVIEDPDRLRELAIA
jgi:hypothetical protein